MRVWIMYDPYVGEEYTVEVDINENGYGSITLRSRGVEVTYHIYRDKEELYVQVFNMEIFSKEDDNIEEFLTILSYNLKNDYLVKELEWTKS